ncbi:hypothetical protein [Paracoccus laeviglucosivorans]|uniref:Uncharacterized protein n=1 Tax=Paracoccus laeviglucosivorans TaxID=1197861 RepID=A0A521E644_9RHOB|nr:hypothetical protein [Paracoccus laeviglucosivorans]SMO79418.1 hypothetical protein SAMN06265221_11180 [Paracoccus laeviglucosivorans]
MTNPTPPRDDAPLYEAQFCKGIPSDCCDYGVVELRQGVEVCRVWTQENAHLIASSMNRRADQPARAGMGADLPIAKTVCQHCQRVTLIPQEVLKAAPLPTEAKKEWHPEDGPNPACDRCGYFIDSLGGCMCGRKPLGEMMAKASPPTEAGNMEMPSAYPYVPTFTSDSTNATPPAATTDNTGLVTRLRSASKHRYIEQNYPCVAEAADALASREAPPAAQVTDAARDVLAERQRQISAEGWTPEHDDAHWREEMALAAACYAIGNSSVIGSAPPKWPWADAWWKPTTPRRNLVKAGALILAEIERLDRQAKTLRHDSPTASLVRDRFNPESEADDAS